MVSRLSLVLDTRDISPASKCLQDQQRLYYPARGHQEQAVPAVEAAGKAEEEEEGVVELRAMFRNSATHQVGATVLPI